MTGRSQRTVDVSNAATGQAFNVQEVAARLPVGRDATSLQLLAPQTTSGDTAFNGVSIAGSSVAENAYYINGMNITNFRTFVGGTTAPFEFYSDIQIKTGGYQAEFGRNTGGAVIAATRSGSNEMHGGMNFFWEPNGLSSDAPATILEIGGQNNSLDRMNNMEGNIWASGALIKDRLFFFGFFNPQSSYQSDTAQAQNDGATTYRNTIRTEQSSNNPFYGGKIDLNIIDGHRVEATYFNDEQALDIVQTDLATGGKSTTTDLSGGENYILRYSGQFTNWLTLSGLYGKSKYNQTSQGSEDGQPSVLDGRPGGTGAVSSGNPNLTIEVGNDERENYRVDADVNLTLLGSHKIRFGYDWENLAAVSSTIYSGGVYYRYYRNTSSSSITVAGGTVPGNTDYVRVRRLNSGGTFESKNRAFYIQDSWTLNQEFNLSLGVRNDSFRNLNAAGEPFTDFKNQWAPRLGINIDPFGDQKTRLSVFYGRYYLPVAANTNIRLAGEETFTQDFYLLSSSNYTGSLTSPSLGGLLGQEVLSGGGVAPASTLVSKNLQPQFQDEIIVGAEHRIDDWTVGVNFTYRNLNKVLEDVDFDGSGSYDSIIERYCGTQNLTYCNSTTTPTIGSSGYVLINPGSDLDIDVVDGNGNLQSLTIPNSFIGLEKAKRTYKAMEFKFDRPFSNGWALSGSYVLAASTGNYEGGVKSDNGQSDTGLTQDFDELGWVDGSYGYLPNHRRHTLKMFGSWQARPNLLFGFNSLLQSPRKFGCTGTYPLDDGRATSSLASSWYCNAQIAAGNVDGTANQTVGRGRVFESNWNKRIDINVSVRVPFNGMDGLTLRADVFNVFNFKSKLDYVETGDRDNADVINPDYGKVSVYQTPRYVRLGASLNF